MIIYLKRKKCQFILHLQTIDEDERLFYTCKTKKKSTKTKEISMIHIPFNKLFFIQRFFLINTKYGKRTSSCNYRI